MLNLSTKSILKMTVPIMLGTFIQNIVLITDSILVYGLGEIKFDAANNAGLLYVCFFMLLRGLGDGTQILVAKEYGLKNHKGIKEILTNSFVLQLGIGILIFLFIYVFKTSFLNFVVQSNIIRPEMSSFLDYRSIGIFFSGIQITIISFYIGIGKTKVLIYSTLLLAFTNIFLDFGLIFGRFGMPKMGLEGAALASSISEGVTALFLILHLRANKIYNELNLSIFKDKLVLYKTKILLKLSSPLMLRGFISLSTWFVFFSLIEQMGEQELAASHVVRNLFFISFIPIFGFGSSTRTYVSYYFAKNEIKNIKTVLFRMITLSFILYFVIFHGAILYPHIMTQLYPWITDLLHPAFIEQKAVYNPETLRQASEILKIIFGSMLLYAAVNVVYNTISALGKTLHALFIELISIVIYLSFTYLFIIKWEWSIIDIWYVEYIYFGSLGVLSIAYLYYYNKQRLKHE